MKKAYLKPNTIQVALRCRVHMLETSNLGGSKGNYTGGQLSRRNNDWDWDDDDE